MANEAHIHSLIKRRMHSNIILESQSRFDLEKLLIRKSDLLSVAYFLKYDPDSAMDFLVDITCIEHDAQSNSLLWNVPIETLRLEILYLFCSTRFDYRVALSILVGESDLSTKSLLSLYQGADWLEREMWDMFGIEIEGHPQTRRLLSHKAIEGHPLRKTFLLGINHE